LLTRKVNGGTRKIGHYANDNARFSSNPNQPTAVSRLKSRAASAMANREMWTPRGGSVRP